MMDLFTKLDVQLALYPNDAVLLKLKGFRDKIKSKVNNSINSNQQVEECPVCGIKRTDGTFYFSHNNTPTVPNKVFSRVCKYVQENPELKPNCINTKGELRDEYTYTPTDTEMEYMLNRLTEL